VAFSRAGPKFPGGNKKFKATRLRPPGSDCYFTQFVQVQRVFIPACPLMFRTEGKPILESALHRTFAKDSRIQWSAEHLVPMAR
jgi:hypothetical protein